MAAAETENKPAAEVLRGFMRAYVGRTRRKRSAAEARRQSRLIAHSADEAEVMNWIRDVGDPLPGRGDFMAKRPMNVPPVERDLFFGKHR